MNWKTGNNIEAGRRLLVKCIEGADPHRIFLARSRQTARGVELELCDDGRVLRGRDVRGVLHAALVG